MRSRNITDSEILPFGFVSFHLMVGKGEAFPGSPPFEFIVGRRTTMMRVGPDKRDPVHRVRCPVKNRSDLERVLCAIDMFLTKRFVRLSSAVDARETALLLFRECLHEAQGRVRLADYKFARTVPEQMSYGELMLACPYFVCRVYFGSSKPPVGFISSLLRCGIPYTFLPLFLAGCGVKLVAPGSKPITPALREEKAVTTFAVCRWDGLEFLVEVGQVHRELLALAPTIIKGLYRLAEVRDGVEF